MLKKHFLFIFFGISACSGSPSYIYEGKESDKSAGMEANFRPKGGFVQKPETAAKIAESVGSEFYGKNVIANQKPLLVTKSGDIWIVRGTSQSGTDIKSGVFEMKLSSVDGAVLGMIHGE